MAHQAEEHGGKKADDTYREELHRSKSWHLALSLASLPEPGRTVERGGLPFQHFFLNFLHA